MFRIESFISKFEGVKFQISFPVSFPFAVLMRQVDAVPKVRFYYWAGFSHKRRNFLRKKAYFSKKKAYIYFANECHLKLKLLFPF